MIQFGRGGEEGNLSFKNEDLYLLEPDSFNLYSRLLELFSAPLLIIWKSVVLVITILKSVEKYNPTGKIEWVMYQRVKSS